MLYTKAIFKLTLMQFFCTASCVAQEIVLNNQAENATTPARVESQKRLSEVGRIAADPAKPAPMPAYRDKSFDQLESRWIAMRRQANKHHLSSVINQEDIANLAKRAGCINRDEAMATGIPHNLSDKNKLNGLSVLSKCKNDTYAVFSIYAIDAQDGKRMNITPAIFNNHIGKKPARKTYFKSRQGLEYSATAILSKNTFVSIEFWSKDELGRSNIVTHLDHEEIFRETD